MEVVPSRVLNLLYVVLDIGFLVFLAGVLLACKRYAAALFGVFGGLLYFLVDYGGFYLLLGTRTVEGADPFWFLLWLSMSYGFTNFAWIWLWLDRDGRTLEWSSDPGRLAGGEPAESKFRGGVPRYPHRARNRRVSWHDGPDPVCGVCHSDPP